MTLNPLEGFQALQTHHCYTGSMRHIYLFNDHNISEEMLLGIGEGVGFIYWHQKDSIPFMGGRALPKPSMEEIAGRRSGVVTEAHVTTSERRARQALLDILHTGQPVMLQVDMGFLPYFQVEGQEYHFGGHIVVACGYDPESDQVLIAERDGLHPVPMANLAKARGSTYKPYPPKNRWYTFDFSHKRQPTAGEIRQAILRQAMNMLEPPISNIGVKGIRKAASRIVKWPQAMSADELRWALFNGHIFIHADGGTGGGIFRYMFSRFLREATAILEEPRLGESADQFQQIGDAWEALGDWFYQMFESSDPAARLGECLAPLHAIADKEQVAWSQLRAHVSSPL